jgi:hypothetical protein
MRIAVSLCLVILLGARAKAEEPAGEGPLTVAEVRALLARDSAIPRERFDAMIRFGSRITPRDAAFAPDLPLTAAVLVLDAGRWCANGRGHGNRTPDLRPLTGEDLAPTNVLELLRQPPPDAPGWTIPAHGDTLLQEHFVVGVTCTGEAGRAGGTAHVRVPGLLEGTLEWTARQVSGRWEVDSFLLPQCAMGVVRVGARWRLARREVGEWQVIPTAVLAVAPDRLARTGTCGGPLRGPTCHLAVLGATLLDEDGEISLPEVARRLAEAGAAAGVDEEGTSLLGLRLRVSAGSPWQHAARILALAARATPRLTRLAFDVAPETPVTGMDASSHGPDGVLTLHVPPADQLGADGPALRLRVRAAATRTSRAATADALARALAGLPASRRHALVSTDPGDGLRAEHVLVTADLLLRAGARSVQFEASDAAAVVPAEAPEGYIVEIVGAPPIELREPPPVFPVDPAPAGHVRPPR